MIKIIQNIREFGSRVIALVSENKSLSLGIAAFVVLATVGGVYLYSSYSGSEVKQAKITDTSLFGRISEGMSKLSTAQKFSLASAMPVLTGLYKVLNTPSVEVLVYRTRLVVPTRIQTFFFSRLAKVFWIVSMVSCIGYVSDFFSGPIVARFPQAAVQASEGVAAKLAVARSVEYAPYLKFCSGNTVANYAVDHGQAMLFLLKINYVMRAFVPFVFHKIATLFSVAYKSALGLLRTVSTFISEYLGVISCLLTVNSVILYLEIPYASDLMLWLIRLLVAAFNFANPVWNFIAMMWNTLCIQTFEDTYLGDKLVGTRIVESVAVNHPFVTLPNTVL